MHKKRIVLMYIIIWIVIVIPLSMWAAYMIKDSNNYCDYENCGLKLDSEYEDYCVPHHEIIWEEIQSNKDYEDYYTPTPTSTPTPTPSPTPYRRRNYSGSYGNVYPNDPSEYSDYEDYYYDNEEDFDGLDDAEDYYEENGGEW